MTPLSCVLCWIYRLYNAMQMLEYGRGSGVVKDKTSICTLSISYKLFTRLNVCSEASSRNRNQAPLVFSASRAPQQLLSR